MQLIRISITNAERQRGDKSTYVERYKKLPA